MRVSHSKVVHRITIFNILAITIISLGILFSPVSCFAINVALDEGQSMEELDSGWIPYAFHTDSLGTAAGVGFFKGGHRQQPQSSIVGTSYLTSNDSGLVMGALSNHQISFAKRLFIDAFALLGHFTDQRFYVDLDYDPSKPRAGSNESAKDDFVTGISNDVQFELTLKYPLAIGNSRGDPVSVYYLNRGLLASGPQGGEIYSPPTSGKTELAVRYFHRYRDLDHFSQEELLTVNSTGLKFWLDHNNTDFPRNPSKGSRQKITITRDFGWLTQSASWTNMDVELSKYVYMGKSDWFRQKVLAFNFWTSNTFSWKTDPSNDQIIYHRPPPGMGSTLGGYDRLRAYPISRFHDKAATYYSIEFRSILNINPLRHMPVLEYFNIDWLQIVGFLEAGRVGPDYNSRLFTEDLKFDGGVSLRLLALHSVVRLDWAISDEGSSIWAMFEQTFAR